MKKISFFIFLVFCSIVARVNCANAEIIKSININGNDRITEQEISQSLKVKIGQNVSEDDLNNILKNVYSTGNFADIAINIKNGVLKVDLLETPIVGDIFFIGSDKFDADEVKKSLSIKSRQVYSKSKIKTDLEKLLVTFKKMGFLNIKIEPRFVFLEDNSVDIIFNIIEGGVSFIDEINFSGNNHFSSEVLKDTILSKQKSKMPFFGNPGNFVEEQLETDKMLIKMFYQDRGYPKVEVKDIIKTFNKRDYNFLLTYLIEEGEFYKIGDINVSGVEIDDEKVKKKIDKLVKKIKKGDIFSMSSIKEVQYYITKTLKENGYAGLSNNYNISYNEEDKTVNITFDINRINKYYIDQITIIGNEKTANNVILREMQINIGDLYDKEKIELSKNRLLMLGYFKQVEIKEETIPYSDLIILKIVVEEQFSGQINGSIGFSDYYGLTGNIIFNINNFLGKGYSFAVNVSRNSFSEGVDISWADPYMFSDKHAIGLSLGVSYNHFGKIWGPKTNFTRGLYYEGHGYSVYGGLSFELATRLSLSITLAHSMRYYKFTNEYPWELYQQFMGTRFTNSVGFSLTYNKMNRYRMATKGYRITYSASIAGLPKCQQYFKTSADFAANIQLFEEDLILHLEASGGYTLNLNNEQPLGMETMYSLGGYTKMRGFDFYGIGPVLQRVDRTGKIIDEYYYALEGKYYYYASAELRSPLFIPKDANVYLSAFVDIGSVWGFGSSQRETDLKDVKVDNVTVQAKEVIRDSNTLRISVGGAITWNSPYFGEIGLYYAKPILKAATDRTLEFGIKFGRGF